LNLIRVMPAKEVVACRGRRPREELMSRSWRTLDIVTVAVIAVVSGVVFWAWNLLWTSTGPLFAAFPPAQALMYGAWLVPGVLGMLVVRRPGASVATAFLAAGVSWLLGAWWGLSVLWYGILQGLAPEAVFAAGGYRRFGRSISLAAGAAAGAVPGVLDLVFWYPQWAAGWKVAWVVGCVVSSAVVAGLGSHALAGQLARTGVLDSFPLGRERAAST
jgi:energy-coupling factor transport system substrate-specific component